MGSYVSSNNLMSFNKCIFVSELRVYQSNLGSFSSECLGVSTY